MNFLRHLDDRLLLAINTFARHTGWLHGPVLAYANYGLLMFAALLITALALARHRDSRRLAAADGQLSPPSPPSRSTSPSGTLSARPARTPPTRVC